MKLTNTRAGSWNGIEPGQEVDVAKDEAQKYIDAGFTPTESIKVEIKGIVESDIEKDAKETAKNIVTEAEKILEEAKKEAEKITTEAQTTAEKKISDATTEAEKILEEAKKSQVAKKTV